jgi:hypothetical protein
MTLVTDKHKSRIYMLLVILTMMKILLKNQVVLIHKNLYWCFYSPNEIKEANQLGKKFFVVFLSKDSGIQFSQPSFLPSPLNSRTQ